MRGLRGAFSRGVRARLAAWLVGVLSGWIGWLSSYAQPVWDAEWEEDREAYEEREWEMSRAYDAGLEQAYHEGYQDAKAEYRPRTW